MQHELHVCGLISRNRQAPGLLEISLWRNLLSLHMRREQGPWHARIVEGLLQRRLHCNSVRIKISFCTNVLLDVD
jgi:hypothetical protein